MPQKTLFACDDAVSQFHPVIQDWFRSRFSQATDPQRQGWPLIAEGSNTLIAAPTGSGKTLTAFLAIIDRLFRQSLAGELENELHVIYLSPLRALSNDMERNLNQPLQEIYELAVEQGFDLKPIKVGLRTGDTPSHRRAALVKKPPHILVTTPESLFLLLTGEKSRQSLLTTNTVIVDEIHALVRDKRGSHLALSVERLQALVEAPLQRIGISATQKPISRIARFLVGSRDEVADDEIDCEIVDVGHTRDLELMVETPLTELSAVCSHEQWEEVNQQIVELIQSHRSTLIFVNTRRLAERVTHQLTQILGEDAVGSHHGSLSKTHRHDVEQRLKDGQLRAVVATASLELGIDVGYIDLVIQIGSPRSIAAFLQRIGRSGHALGLTPKGLLFALTRDELVECMGLIRAVKAGRLDVIPIPNAPLDILAQQIVGEVANEEWDVEELFTTCQRAWPYRNLKREEFENVLTILSQGLTPGAGRVRALIHYDHVNGRIKGRKAARIIALNNSGAIAEIDSVRVVLDDENTVVGSVDEDFAIESSAGDIFLLGNSSWRIQGLRGNDLIVSDAQGAPPSIPFWRGEAPGRTIELSEEVSLLREEIDQRLIEAEKNIKDSATNKTNTESQKFPPHWKPVVEWLCAETDCHEFAAWQIVTYIAAQKAAIGIIPTTKQVVFERFFDESGGMQLVVHAPFGGRINRAWGLAFRKRFCRSFDFELQATADDDGFILSLGPQHSFPIESLFPMMRVDNAQNLLEQALLIMPMFHLRWRWNVTRSLFVDRMKNGKKVPPALQRFRTEDLLTAVFPKLTGCQENIVGDHEIPDHPIMQQTMEDCLREALDIDALVEVLKQVDADEITYIGRDTREPSPFAYELLNANPYAFLDGGEVQERRARAVATRRSLNVESVRDLGNLDPAAIESVVDESQPLIRDPDELHDALVSRFLVPVLQTSNEILQRLSFQPNQHTTELAALVESQRIIQVQLDEETAAWVPVERWPPVQLVWSESSSTTEIQVPTTVRQDWNEEEALVAILRGLIEISGPLTAVDISQLLKIPTHRVFGGLVALEGEGLVLRGHFRNSDPTIDSESELIEWCHRGLLARIHRRTIAGLRSEIEPVEFSVFQQFLLQHQGALVGHQASGADGVFKVVAQLQGLDLAASAWEEAILPLRVSDYKPENLDENCLAGEVGWGRLTPVNRKQGASRPMASVTRAVPISFFLQDDLPWLAQRSKERSRENLGSAATEVLELLEASGALFARDLLKQTDLLPSQLDEILGELVSYGWITADGFAGLRKLIQTKVEQRKRRRTSPLDRQPTRDKTIGRWTTWHPNSEAGSDENFLEQWAWQLLRRWGVVFRDLVIREPLAPQWWELLRVYRRLEARGEIRGGRFIRGVGGEQFAVGESVRLLRSIRDTKAADEIITISAADPLNLTGLLPADQRIPALANNRIVYCKGVVIGWKKGEETWIDNCLNKELKSKVATALGIKKSRQNRLDEYHFEHLGKKNKTSKKKQERKGAGIPKPFPF